MIIIVIRGLIESYYDIQKVRIAVENQLRSLEQGKSEQEYKWFKDTVYSRLIATEKDIAKHMESWVEEEEIYTEWLKNIKGIGPVLAAGLIAWVDGESPTYGTGFTTRFATISKLWAYAGLSVDGEGKAVRRKKGQKANWDARLKSHLWKIGESFVKGGDGYRTLYETFRAEYDAKWLTPEDCGSKGCANKGKGKCLKGHRYAAAKRKTVKVFLAHLFMKWRELEGLPIEHPFIIGRNGHEHLIEIIEK